MDRFRRPPAPAGGVCGWTTLTRDGGWPSSRLREGPRTRAAEPDLTGKRTLLINNWISSFVSEDKTRTFCVYDAPAPEATRKAAIGNELPIDQITQVRVPSPYFCA
jgi:hypothetical protein